MTPQPDVLISERELEERIAALAGDISAVYSDGSPPVLVCVLKGATTFMADLVRAMSIDVECDFMSISSYAGGGGSGVVQIVKDLESEVTGRDVLIVEDIVDTGLTLNYLRRTLDGRKPRSLKTVALLDKAVRRIVPVECEWSGFEIPDVYVLGYGIDHQGYYRNLKELVVADDIARLAATPDLYVDSFWPEPPPTD